VLCATGCQGDLSPQGRQLLRAGYDTSRNADYPTVISKTDQFLRQFGKSDQAGEAYYLRGLAHYRLGDRQGAKADLAEAISQNNLPELKARSAVVLGDIAREEQDLQLAEKHYRQALGFCEKDKSPADHAYYWLGCVLQRQGRWQEADIQFSRVVYLFGDSPLVQSASRRINCRVWTVQVGVFDTKQAAELSAERLVKLGQPVSEQAVLVGGRVKHAIHAGRYSTYEQALSAKADLAGLSADSIIVATR